MDLEKDADEVFVGNEYEHVTKLSNFVESYLKKEWLKVGDIVVWKDGMKNKKLPAYGQPAIVLSLSPGKTDPSTGGGGYDGEPLDVRLAIVRDGDIKVYEFDSARFKISLSSSWDNEID